MEQPFSVLDMMVFFDESGNNQVKPHLMAGLAIPTKYYNNENIQQLNEKIKATKIHWTEYSGDSKERNTIWRIINTVMEHHYLLKMNVILIINQKLRNLPEK